MAKKAVNLLCNRRMVSSPDNPFSADGRKPRRPLVTDRKMRDALLRKEFDTPSVPSDLDAIVIGGGVSGLSTAATLSKAGKRTSQSCIIFVLHRSKISFIEQDHKMIYLQIDLCS